MIRIFALHGSAVSWLSFPLENEIRDSWESLSIDGTVLLDACFQIIVFFRGEHQTLFSRLEICDYKRIFLPYSRDTWKNARGVFLRSFSPSSLEEVSVLLPFWSSDDAELPESLHGTCISSSDPFSLCNRSKYLCALLATSRDRCFW